MFPWIGCRAAVTNQIRGNVLSNEARTKALWPRVRPQHVRQFSTHTYLVLTYITLALPRSTITHAAHVITVDISNHQQVHSDNELPNLTPLHTILVSHPQLLFETFVDMQATTVSGSWKPAAAAVAAQITTWDETYRRQPHQYRPRNLDDHRISSTEASICHWNTQTGMQNKLSRDLLQNSTFIIHDGYISCLWDENIDEKILMNAK